MQLSRRMQRLASLVTEGNRLADVGTDHGYVPIALVRERKIPSAVAMDVNKGPLARAEEHIREAGLSTYIRLRRSDGLQELQAGEADTILIAGMGGMLMVRILEEGGHCLDMAEELILQPQSDIYMVRRWLSEHRYVESSSWPGTGTYRAGTLLRKERDTKFSSDIAALSSGQAFREQENFGYSEAKPKRKDQASL